LTALPRQLMTSSYLTQHMMLTDRFRMKYYLFEEENWIHRLSRLCGSLVRGADM